MPAWVREGINPSPTARTLFLVIFILSYFNDKAPRPRDKEL